MSLVRNFIKALADGLKIHPSDILGNGGGGRTFWVKVASSTGYAQFFTDHNVVDEEDKTNSVYNTIQAAINACTDSRGDVIYLAPGYTETVTASSHNLNKDDVTIISLGHGLNRAVLTYNAAASTFDITADDSGVHNVHHITSIDNVAAAYTLAAAKDFTLSNNTFTDTSSSDHFLSILVTSAVANAHDGLKVVHNTWTGLAIAATAFVVILEGMSRLTVSDNKVFGASTSDIGHFITLATFVCLSVEIERNTLIVTGATNATAGVFMTGSGASLGVVRDNVASSLDTGSELMFEASGGLDFFDNKYTGVADASGKLAPLIDAA